MVNLYVACKRNYQFLSSADCTIWHPQYPSKAFRALLLWFLLVRDFEPPSTLSVERGQPAALQCGAGLGSEVGQCLDERTAEMWVRELIMTPCVHCTGACTAQ